MYSDNGRVIFRDDLIPQPSRPHLHTLTAGAGLPLAQAAITGGVAVVVVAVLGYVLRWRSPLLAAAAAGGLMFGGMWFYLARHWLRLTSFERVRGQVSEPRESTVPQVIPEAARSVRVQVDQVTEAGHIAVTKLFDLPATWEQISALASGLLAGETLSERAWTGAGRPFSVDGFRALRSEMLKRGLIVLASAKDARQGYILTVAGRHVLAAIQREGESD